MNVGVGIFTSIAKPHHVDTGGEQFRGHATMRVHFVLLPPIVAVVKHDVDLNASAFGVDERLHKVHLV